MVSIQRYEPNHREGTIRLISNILEKEFNFEVNESTFPDIYHIDEKFQKDKGDFWVAIERKKVIGTIGLLDMKEGRGYLKRMFVAEKHRGTGVASQLLETLVGHARKNSMNSIYLTTIPEMIAAMTFYEKNRFESIASLPKDLPTYGDHIFYRLRLR